MDSCFSISSIVCLSNDSQLKLTEIYIIMEIIRLKAQWYINNIAEN